MSECSGTQNPGYPTIGGDFIGYRSDFNCSHSRVATLDSYILAVVCRFPIHVLVRLG